MEQIKLDEQKERMYAVLFGGKEERAITHRDVEAIRERIGIEVPQRHPYNEEATRDGMRKYILGIGDGNPLYWDEEYAKETRWGGLIAHPLYLQTTGTSVKSELDPGERAKGYGAMSGIHALDGGDEFYFYRPIRLGDFMWSKKYLTDVQVKKSQFAGTNVVTQDRQFWANDKSELLAARTKTTVWVGRERRAGERTKYSHIKDRIRYNPEDIQLIDADMDKEEVRGADPRYWEDVNEGDELIPVVKGPVLYVDMFNFNIGHGMSVVSGAHRWSYEYRKKHPGAFAVNRFGFPDTVESVIFAERQLAHQAGIPAEYVYGDLLFSWLVHLVTNWMGDDAWLYHVSSRYQEPVFMYDTNWVKGKVVRKYRDDARQYKVDIEIHSEDNRSRTPITGQATVILPSKTGGAPKVPPVDTPAPFTPEEVEVPTEERP